MDSSQDQTLKCRDCKQDFVFTAGEQQFFAERQFTPPTRCKPCRQANKARKDAVNGGSAAGPAMGGYPVSNGGGPGPRVYEAAPPSRRGGGRQNNRRGGGGGGRGGGGRGYDDYGD
jgi:hypothetical protein